MTAMLAAQELQVGDICLIHGIQARPELNGSLTKLKSVSEVSEDKSVLRFAVENPTTSGESQISIKKSNLQLVFPDFLINSQIECLFCQSKVSKDKMVDCKKCYVAFYCSDQCLKTKDKRNHHSCEYFRQRIKSERMHIQEFLKMFEFNNFQDINGHELLKRDFKNDSIWKRLCQCNLKEYPYGKLDVTTGALLNKDSIFSFWNLKIPRNLQKEYIPTYDKIIEKDNYISSYKCVFFLFFLLFSLFFLGTVCKHFFAQKNLSKIGRSITNSKR